MLANIKKIIAFALKERKMEIFRLFVIIFISVSIMAFFSRYNYLFFHSAIEMASVGVMFLIFSLAFHSRYLIRNNYFIFFGITIIFSAGLVLLHTLAYKGMSVFPGTLTNANLATQLWLAAQIYLASSFLLAPYFINKKLNVKNVLAFYSIASVLVIASIFYLKIFPASFVEGVGLTSFKKTSELIIIFSFILGLALLIKNRRIFNSKIFYLLCYGFIVTIFSEITFTLYFSTSGYISIAGHILRLIGFACFYRAFVGIGLKNPYNLILRTIKQNEDNLKSYSAKLSEEKIRAEALLLSIADGVVVTDNKAKVIFINKAVEKFSGLKMPEIIGRELNEVLPFFTEKNEPIPIEERPIYQAINNKKIDKLPIESPLAFYLKNKNGKKVPVAARAAPYIVNGINQGAVAIWRNISKELEVETAKNEFVSFASHQLKTPLTTISLSLEMLRSESEGLTKEQKDLLKTAVNGKKEMEDLIENLLNISKIQMGTLNVNPEVLNLTNIANGILKNLFLSFKENNISLVKKFPKDLPYIKGDQHILKLVLTNCISNAIKYNQRNGVIVVEMKQTEKDIIISISDSGYGIPKEDQTMIFEKFFQSGLKGHEGSGLGLYIAKYAISQIGGKIWCESPSDIAFHAKKTKLLEKQIGTTFYISVPIVKVKTEKKIKSHPA